MNPRKKLNEKRVRRGKRVSSPILGTAERPRLSVYRSNRHFYAQLIDDTKGKTLLSASSMIGAKTAANAKKEAKSKDAFAVGETFGKKAVEKGITAALFDRGSYKFHGRVKSFADGAKKAGLII